MTSGSWGCPHEVNGRCLKVDERPCDPGMKARVLFGRFLFSDPAKNRSLKDTPNTSKKRSRTDAD
ncbi:MAG: hypothetical protein HZA23_00935 [Nitrospirae bacterium]|nr:hypothetical protein [Nitrospirota bacterium]